MIDFKNKILHNDALKAKLHEIIFGTDTPMGKAFDVVLIAAIAMSVVLTIFQTFIEITWLRSSLIVLEIVFTVFFTLEYILRIYCSPEPKKYIFSFFGIVDLVSILPVYLGFIYTGARFMIVIRAFRLVRVFRVFKLFNFLNEGNMLLRSMQKSAKKIMVFFLFVFIVNMCLGSIMYMVESYAGNPAFNNIPNGIYWSIVTMTTVGYGDITPISTLGKFISACVMLFGYTIIAVPTGIVTATMADENRKIQARRRGKNVHICPRCGFEEYDKEANFCRRCGAMMSDDNTLDKL